MAPKRTVVLIAIILGILLLIHFQSFFFPKTDKASAPSGISNTAQRQTSSVEALNQTSHQTPSTLDGQTPSSTLNSDANNTAEREKYIQLLQTNSSRPWTIKLDMNQRFVSALSGGTLSLPGKTPEEKSLAFAKQYSQALFGVMPEQLLVQSTSITDRTRVVLNQTVDGLVVYGSQMALFFEDGALTKLHNDLVPCTSCSLSGKASISKEAAMQLAQVSAKTSTVTPKLDSMIAIASQGNFYPAYLLYVDNTQQAAEHFEVIVDAIHGNVVRSRNIIRQ